MTTDQPDFIALYRELGIDPGCSVDELRLAYRRRVADLHPDRIGASGEDDLKSLNLRYAAALEFHRHYGRLPGAAPVPVARVPRESPAVPEQEAAPAEAPEPRRPSKFVVYGIMLVAMLLVWWFSRTGAGSPAIHGMGVATSERETTPRSAIALRTGMSRTEVVALLGYPVTREHGDTRWLYGASWVRFDCGEVVDWYSSPLKPLKASRSRPPAATAQDGPPRCASGASAGQRW